MLNYLLNLINYNRALLLTRIIVNLVYFVQTVVFSATNLPGLLVSRIQ